MKFSSKNTVSMLIFQSFTLVIWSSFISISSSFSSINVGIHHLRRSPFMRVDMISSVESETATINTKNDNNNNNNGSNESKEIRKLEGKLKKQIRQMSLKYKMIEDGDHIMCCVSGGKDSATMLHLLIALQKKLKPQNINFKITAVHLNQLQPGYDGAPLVEWLEGLVQNGSLDEYKIITEDTYSIVIDKTPENKVYCSLCSRLRRGILYTVAHDIQANKIALGHHGDDAIQTLLLNLIHTGQMKGIPARYYSSERDIHVIRPLISSLEEDIEIFAQAKQFPILPCNLCGTQPDAQRAKVKMLVDTTLSMLNPQAKRNIINGMGDVRPSHLLDFDLRTAVGIDGATGVVIDESRAKLVKGESTNPTKQSPDDEQTQVETGEQDQGKSTEDYLSQSRIENLL